MAGTGTKQRMAHVNDSHLGLRSHPLGRVSCLAAMEPRTGGWWRMEGRDGRFFTFEGRVGAREAGEPREERGEGRALARSQCGDGEGRGMQSFDAMKSLFEVRDRRYE